LKREDCIHLIIIHIHTMSQYQSVHLAARPKSEIVAGETFEVRSNAVPKESDLKDGQVIFRSLYLSLDPAMRGWLNGKL
jgi:NADPH-dependent curcumin reductase CurA